MSRFFREENIGRTSAINLQREKEREREIGNLLLFEIIKFHCHGFFSDETMDETKEREKRSAINLRRRGGEKWMLAELGESLQRGEKK